MLDPEYLDYVDFMQPYLKQVKEWRLTYCIIPRRCILTNKIIWFKQCYKGTRIIYDFRVAISAKQGLVNTFLQPVKKEYYYMNCNDFIVWTLSK